MNLVVVLGNANEICNYHGTICGLDNFYLQLTSQCKHSKNCIRMRNLDNIVIFSNYQQNILSLVEKFHSLNTILIEMGFFVL